MKHNVTRLARFGALLPVAVAALAATARAQQPFDTSAWDISAAEWRVEPYRGRSALLLREGAAWLRGSRFQNGTIEFDIAFSEVSGFPGIAFRAATHDDYELFYLRAEPERPAARHPVHAGAPRPVRLADLRRPRLGGHGAVDIRPLDAREARGVGHPRRAVRGRRHARCRSSRGCAARRAPARWASSRGPGRAVRQLRGAAGGRAVPRRHASRRSADSTSAPASCAHGASPRRSPSR